MTTGKAQTQPGELVLAGIRRRSYSIWFSPLVVIADANGSIRLTCKYERAGEQSTLPMLPLLAVDDLLSDFGGSSVYSTMDLVSVLFSVRNTQKFDPANDIIYAVRKLGVDNNADGAGVYPAVVSVNYVNGGGGLKRVRMFIDDIVCFSRTGQEQAGDLARCFALPI